MKFGKRDILYVVLIAFGSVLGVIFGRKYLTGYIAVAIGFILIFAGAYINHEWASPLLYGIGAVVIADPLADMIHF